MTAYWDWWGTQVEKIEHEAARVAFTELIAALHDYEHEHGGHVLDTYLIKKKYLEMKKKELEKSVNDAKER